MFTSRYTRSLRLNPAKHISDCLRTIGQSIPALSDKVPALQRTGTDQRQSDICRDHYVTSASVKKERKCDCVIYANRYVVGVASSLYLDFV